LFFKEINQKSLLYSFSHSKIVQNSTKPAKCVAYSMTEGDVDKKYVQYMMYSASASTLSTSMTRGNSWNMNMCTH